MSRTYNSPVLMFHSLGNQIHTVESRFLEPPRETKIGSRNREFEKSKVASNVAKLLRYSFIRGNHAYFRRVLLL